MLTYKQSGVDIDEGNRAVDLIKGKIKSTYDNNVIGDLGNFSGLYSLKEFVGMEEPVLLFKKFHNLHAGVLCKLDSV